MNCFDMPRRPKNFLLDERIIDALAGAAKKAGYKGPNKFVEAALFNLLKMSGDLPKDAEPLPETRGKKPKDAEPLPETRGGSNKKDAGKPKTTPSPAPVDPTSTPADRSGGEVGDIEN
jgi:hypothetical protein